MIATSDWDALKQNEAYGMWINHEEAIKQLDERIVQLQQLQEHVDQLRRLMVESLQPMIQHVAAQEMIVQDLEALSREFEEHKQIGYECPHVGV